MWVAILKSITNVGMAGGRNNVAVQVFIFSLD